MGEYLHNRKYLKEIRKELRNNLTPSEATLWRMLKGKQLEGRKFRRQHSIANYIVDFYCPSEHLIIEVDGSVHLDLVVNQNDYIRDEYLIEKGFKVLRFTNDEVRDDIMSVLERIKEEFHKDI